MAKPSTHLERSPYFFFFCLPAAFFAGFGAGLAFFCGFAEGAGLPGFAGGFADSFCLPGAAGVLADGACPTACLPGTPFAEGATGGCS